MPLCHLCHMTDLAPPMSQISLLDDITDGSQILIFMDTEKGCDQIMRQLWTDGWPALSIHSDKSKAERDWVLSEFKAGKSPIMTSTDVAACVLAMIFLDPWRIMSTALVECAELEQRE